MTDSDEALVEALCSAHRERDPRGGLHFHPAFYDLDDAGRRQGAERALAQRRLEAALDPGGLSGTARAVLQRIAQRD